MDLNSISGIQTTLYELGYYKGYVDGIPGPQTTAAVIAFQTDQGLTPDGIVGPATRDRLERAQENPLAFADKANDATGLDLPWYVWGGIAVFAGYMAWKYRGKIRGFIGV